MLKIPITLEKSSAFLGKSVSDLWRGMVSRKSHVSELKKSMRDLWLDMASCNSHVSELKNWMPKHS